MLRSMPRTDLTYSHLSLLQGNAFYCILLYNYDKVTAWNMKCRSRSPGQSTCLKSILRTVIIMQEYISITAAEKHTLQHRFMSVNGA